MKRIVKYIALDPYYSDVTQTYIGADSVELDDIQWETEEFMQGKALFPVYKAITIEDEYGNKFEG